MKKPLILLPPSEGKAVGGSGPAFTDGSISFPELDADRRRVAAALAAAMDDDALAAKLLGVKGAALESARAANRAVLSAPTQPAILRYTGVLYDAFDYPSLSPAIKKRAAQQVVIFSGLWGAVRAGDPIPHYKLKMGASLAGLGKLNTFWKPSLTAALAPLVDGQAVWDLLPNEHVAAWNPEPGSLRTRISVKFVDEATDPSTGQRKRSVVNHWNKLLKGALVRHVLETQLSDHDGLARFEHPLGYVYDPALTTEARGVTRVTLIAQRD
ncbi:MAG: peroxide stress protein YaaA [Actinobacteria bacterium]|nr:peroxide stress protein YaaA [Actinomycetota bacterium]